MSEQLYRWVKASESPKNESYFKGRNMAEDRELNLHWDGENWFVIYKNAEVKIPKNDIKYYEYQPDEPYAPSPVSGSLEEAATEYAKGMLGEYDPELQEEYDAIMGHFLAGANYVNSNQ